MKGGEVRAVVDGVGHGLGRLGRKCSVIGRRRGGGRGSEARIVRHRASMWSRKRKERRARGREREREGGWMRDEEEEEEVGSRSTKTLESSSPQGVSLPSSGQVLPYRAEGDHPNGPLNLSAHLPSAGNALILSSSFRSGCNSARLCLYSPWPPRPVAC